MTKRTSIVLMMLLSAMALTPVSAQQPAGRAGRAGQRGGGAGAGLSAETRQKLMESLQKGAAFLGQKQKADGNWESHPGINAMVVTAILRQPGPDSAKRLATAGKALDALAKLAKPGGGIYEKDIPH